MDGIRGKEVPDYGGADTALAIYAVTAMGLLPPVPSRRLEYPIDLPRGAAHAVTLVLGRAARAVHRLHRGHPSPSGQSSGAPAH